METPRPRQTRLHTLSGFITGAAFGGWLTVFATTHCAYSPLAVLLLTLAAIGAITSWWLHRREPELTTVPKTVFTGFLVYCTAMYLMVLGYSNYMGL